MVWWTGGGAVGGPERKEEHILRNFLCQKPGV